MTSRQLRSPTSLLVSQDAAAVYLADGFDPTAPANRQLFRFGYTTTANSTAGLVLEQVVESQRMQHVTGVTENPGDGALFVTGFNAAAYDEYATFNEGDAIAATASLAVVCPGFDLITAAELTGYPLALPLGTTTTCRREACTTICRPLLNGPQPETNPTAKNRYLSFVPSNPGQETALHRAHFCCTSRRLPAPAGTPDWSPVEGFARYVNAIRDENDLPVFDCPDSASAIRPSSVHAGLSAGIPGLGCDHRRRGTARHRARHCPQLDVRGVAPGVQLHRQ